MQKVDNLIVGAGLAGVWMAFRFIQMNKSFVLIDTPSANSSSRIAAGIVNPLLAKHQKLSFQAKKIYPELGKKYHEAEHDLHQKFYHKHPILYILESMKELNDWAAHAESEWFADFVMIKNERISDLLISDFGYIEIQDSGWVDVPLFLDSFIKRIHSPNIYLQAHFRDEALKVSDSGFEYNGFLADHIVFCQGSAIHSNKFTAHIPIKPAKGEILEVETEELIEYGIPQHGVFMLPIKKHHYRIGSNFSWDDLTTETTEAAKNEIIQKWTSWYKGPYDIISQVAGIRPSSLDRRPLLGRLNFHPSAFVLNGFGSKGVSLAPFYSDMLSKYIYGEGELDPEVNISRLNR